MRSLKILGLLLVTSAFVVLPVAADETGTAYGVFEYVVENAEGTFEEIGEAIASGVPGGAWELLGTVESRDEKKCDYRSRVFVFHELAYGAAMITANPATGGFAVVDRVGLFEDENGIHVSVVNPHSINRTVLMDDTAHEALTEEHLQELRTRILGVVRGTESHRQYGQMRTQGHIGKTMGVVAGGKFVDLIQEKGKIKNGDVSAVAAQLRNSLDQPSKKWGLHLIYEVAIPEHDMVVFGTSGSPMDFKSFSIVGAGLDESRKDFACPGFDHAAAYPLEIVVSRQGDEVGVSIVDAMFRMKMFFEDAGKWAFMNNMKMPGSIDKELKKQIKNGLKAL